MSRIYRKSRRAEAESETREKIVRATMALHLEQGIATTSYSDVALRAGVGAATVYRHFPTTESLVEACGAHFWSMIEPPLPRHAAAIFAGLETRPERVRRLAAELDAFYQRAEAPLWSAFRDQDRIAPLARFLEDVRKSISALVAEALRQDPRSERVSIVTALMDFAVWRALAGTGAGPRERTAIMIAILEAIAPPAGSAAGRIGRPHGMP